MTAVQPNCLKCINYYITHDPAKPYGCRALGFKSRSNPARVAFISSGLVCQLYSPKKQEKDGSGSPRMA
jgi:hypothetical protein